MNKHPASSVKLAPQEILLAEPRGFCAGVDRAIEIVERALQKNLPQHIYCYFGVRTERDLYLHDDFAKLAGSHKNLHFIPVLSEGDGLVRRCGLVHDAVAADFQFHHEIACATQNSHFADMMNSLGSQSIPRSRLETNPAVDAARLAYLRRVHHEHENILNAIATQDAESARAAMRTHLSNSRDRHKKGESSHH